MADAVIRASGSAPRARRRLDEREPAVGAEPGAGSPGIEAGFPPCRAYPLAQPGADRRPRPHGAPRTPFISPSGSAPASSRNNANASWPLTMENGSTCVPSVLGALTSTPAAISVRGRLDVAVARREHQRREALDGRCPPGRRRRRAGARTNRRMRPPTPPTSAPCRLSRSPRPLTSAPRAMSARTMSAFPRAGGRSSAGPGRSPARRSRSRRRRAAAPPSRCWRSRSRALQRRHAMVVGEVHVRAGGEQPFDELHVVPVGRPQ